MVPPVLLVVISWPARVSNVTSASPARVFAVPFVMPTNGDGSSDAAISSATRTTSALSPDWLTATTTVDDPRSPLRKCASSAASTWIAPTPARASSATAG